MLIGLVAGVVAGLLGVGGGALFVPALTIGLGLSQLDAEATSLLAIVPVALVGAVRQRAHGNVDVRTGVALGIVAVAGAVVGVVIANIVPERGLEIGFGLFLLFVVWRLVRRAVGSGHGDSGAGLSVGGSAGADVGQRHH
ncbi:MAG: TSUP family transporter [Solirubrobacteraceae bacterium]|nr:TSUP family transporter [Solirubrobacteraceae bacterium]